MSSPKAISILLLAAILEAAGDAVVRFGLHAGALYQRVLLLLSGAAILFVYGCTVNAPNWDFGRLLGVYVVFFFVIAQLVSWFFFAQPPSKPVLAGGALIVIGGAIISLFQ